MFYLKVDERKLNSLINNLEIFRNDIVKRFGNSRRKIAKTKVVPSLRTHMPIKTGNLRTSVTTAEVDKNTTVIGHDRLKTKTEDGNHSYGDIVYYGIRKGYWIYPKRASVLRFEINGEVVYAKKVFIPPRAGNKFIDRTVIDLKRDRSITQVIVEELSKNRYLTFK